MSVRYPMSLHNISPVSHFVDTVECMDLQFYRAPAEGGLWQAFGNNHEAFVFVHKGEQPLGLDLP